MANLFSAITPEEKASATQAIIEHGPWAAAAVLIFGVALSLVWYVLRTSTKELARAHEETRKANERSSQAQTKSTEVNTQLKDRMDTMLNLMDKVLDRLHDALTGRQR